MKEPPRSRQRTDAGPYFRGVIATFDTRSIENFAIRSKVWTRQICAAGGAVSTVCAAPDAQYSWKHAKLHTLSLKTCRTCLKLRISSPGFSHQDLGSQQVAAATSNWFGTPGSFNALLSKRCCRLRTFLLTPTQLSARFLVNIHLSCCQPAEHKMHMCQRSSLEQGCRYLL